MKTFKSLFLLMLILTSAIVFTQNTNPGQLKTTTQEVNKSSKMLLANDVGIYSFSSPTSGPYLGEEEIVTIRIKNFGGVTQNNIPVYYTLDGGTQVTGIVPGPISPGETEDFTFPGTVNLSNPGQSYVFVGCTELEGDDNPANDCKTIMIVGWPTEYCDASTTNQQEYVHWVGCGNIDKYSSWQAGVADYTALSTSLPAGWSEPISVTIGNARAGDSVTMWIDWDQDYFFGTDANEIYQMTDYDGTGQYFDDTITVPEETLPGDYRMRIRLTYNSTPEPCGVAEYGEIEDYTVVVYVPPVNDVGVEAIISPKTDISPGNEIVTIRVKNLGSATQTNIPVFYTLDGGTPVPGMIKGPLPGGYTSDYCFNGFADLTDYGAHISLNTCVTLAGDENAENDCQTITVSTDWPYYVDGSTSTEDEYIANVLFGSINNSSGWQGNTADYTDQFTIIPTGESETITVTNGNAYASDIVYVWVDWNKDYRFDWWGGPEEYHLTNVGGTGEQFTGEITAPGGQAAGDYRMRVRMTYSYPPDPCGNASYGEVEDYTLIVDADTPPQIRVNPMSLAQILEPGESAVQSVILSNVGELPLTFDISVNTGNNVMKSSFSDNPNQLTDIGVIAILSPVTGVNIGDEIVTITVKNFGNDLQSNIPVGYSINSQDTISDIVPGTLVSGESVDFTFPGTVDLGISGQVYVIKAFTTLPGDENADNDCETAFVNNLFTGFCEAITTREDEFISNVHFGDINNSSEWQDSVSDFTNIFTTIEAGSSENIIVTNGLPYTNDRVFAWVDWDKNRDFNTSDEQYVLTDQNGTGDSFTGEIAVPQNQPSGNYRMRIRMCYFTESVPCGGSTYGEVEEYSIKVINNQTIPWLSVEPLTGVVNPGDSVEVNVTFNSTGLPFGSYTGSIVFTSNDPAKPFTTIPVTLVVSNCLLPAPANFTVIENPPLVAHLSWEPPEISGGIIRWDDGVNYDGIGTGSVGLFHLAARWTGAQLIGYDGLYLTDVDFFPRSNGSTVYTLKIWTGVNASTLIHSQPLAGLTLNEWNTVLLSNPVQISSATELWIGYECNSQSVGDYPAGCDAGPAVAGFGDMVSINGTVSWQTLSGYGLNYNWNIAGIISTGPDGKPLTQPIHIGQSYSNTCASVAQGNLPKAANPQWTGSNRDLLGYNVYRDGFKINTSIYSGLFFDDPVNIQTLRSYCVSAVYQECESPSETISILITEIPENENSTITIFPNPAQQILNIKSQNTINQISILNIPGQVVYSGDFESQTVQLNTSHFRKGIYIIQVKTLEGSIVKKLVME